MCNMLSSCPMQLPHCCDGLSHLEFVPGLGFVYLFLLVSTSADLQLLTKPVTTVSHLQSIACLQEVEAAETVRNAGSSEECLDCALLWSPGSWTWCQIGLANSSRWTTYGSSKASL